MLALLPFWCQNKSGNMGAEDMTSESSRCEAFLPTDIMELAATKNPSLLPFAFTFLIHAVSWASTTDSA